MNQELILGSSLIEMFHIRRQAAAEHYKKACLDKESELKTFLKEIEAAEQSRDKHLQTADRQVVSTRKHLSSAASAPTAAAAAKAAQDAKASHQIAKDNYTQAETMCDKQQELDALALEIASVEAVDSRMSTFY